MGRRWTRNESFGATERRQVKAGIGKLCAQLQKLKLPLVSELSRVVCFRARCVQSFCIITSEGAGLPVRLLRWLIHWW